MNAYIKITNVKINADLEKFKALVLKESEREELF
jgi:hypothetical protein